jgi:hypothetical protein
MLGASEFRLVEAGQFSAVAENGDTEIGSAEIPGENQGIRPRHESAPVITGG